MYSTFGTGNQAPGNSPSADASRSISQLSRALSRVPESRAWLAGFITLARQKNRSTNESKEPEACRSPDGTAFCKTNYT